MAAFSDIQWCDDTFNAVEGCVKVSAACTNCYAEERNIRFHAGKNWGPNSRRLQRSEAYWRQPDKWNAKAKADGRRRRVFCCSLADVFEDHPDWNKPRARLWKTIERTTELDWLLLTKRPENFHRFLPWGQFDQPWANVWLGVTAEDNDCFQVRVPQLLQIPAVVRFVSMEPLLEDVDIPRDWLEPFHGIDGMLRQGARIAWAIVGGESGHKARPMPLRWARRVRRLCRETKTAFFMKQIGSKIDASDGLVELGKLKHKNGGDPAEWPEDLRVREFPKARAA